MNLNPELCLPYVGTLMHPILFERPWSAALQCRSESHPGFLVLIAFASFLFVFSFLLSYNKHKCDEDKWRRVALYHSQKSYMTKPMPWWIRNQFLTMTYGKNSVFRGSERPGLLSAGSLLSPSHNQRILDKIFSDLCNFRSCICIYYPVQLLVDRWLIQIRRWTCNFQPRKK